MFLTKIQRSQITINYGDKRYKTLFPYEWVNLFWLFLDLLRTVHQKVKNFLCTIGLFSRLCSGELQLNKRVETNCLKTRQVITLTVKQGQEYQRALYNYIRGSERENGLKEKTL